MLTLLTLVPRVVEESFQNYSRFLACGCLRPHLCLMGHVKMAVAFSGEASKSEMVGGEGICKIVVPRSIHVRPAIAIRPNKYEDPYPGLYAEIHRPNPEYPLAQPRSDGTMLPPKSCHVRRPMFGCC